MLVSFCPRLIIVVEVCMAYPKNTPIIMLVAVVAVKIAIYWLWIQDPSFVTRWHLQQVSEVELC